MRRVLRLPEDAGRSSIFDAQQAFHRSVFISAARCLFTYVFLPVLGPVLGFTGSVGPVLGLAVGTVSVVAIVFATRRFFAADHPWRWRYTAIGAAIIVLLIVQSVIDVRDLAT
jgi:multisubunit Na+/H+ antiporter MnhE subunit